MVVLRNGDAGILAEAGGDAVSQERQARYSDYNRVTGSLRQPGSAMKPFVYLAAFRQGLDLDTTVADEPIEVPLGAGRGTKWIANYDDQFKGSIPDAPGAGRVPQRGGRVDRPTTSGSTR